MQRASFAKLGPVLATQADGPVIPFSGEFYRVAKVETDAVTGQTHLKIQRMSPQEIEQQYGLNKCKGKTASPT